MNRASSSIMRTLLLLAVLLWAGENLHAMEVTEGGLNKYPENTSTNYTVTTPGIVSIAFTSSNASGYTHTGNNVNVIGMPGAVNNIPESITVTNNTTGEVIAYLNLTNYAAATTFDNTNMAAVMVSALGSSVTLNGTYNNNGIGSTISYAGGSSGAANTSLSGRAMSGALSGTYTGVNTVSNPGGSPDYDVEYNTDLDTSGVFSFYAPTAGTYTITEVALGEWQDLSANDYVPSGGMSFYGIDQYLAISFITNTPSSPAPSGSLSVSKIAGGGGGVTLNWSITPPPKQ